MNDSTATQTQSAYTGPDWEPGVGESRPSNRIYVNLRCGDIAETSNKEREGFAPETTKNLAGTEYHFFAKKHPHLTGHVVDIKWHTHTLKNGTTLTGWNIFIDVGGPKLFVLGVGSQDQPYARLMATLPGVNFERTVRFVGFMGEYKNRPQKVLLLSQERDAAGEPIWLQPRTQAKWLSRSIIDKLKHGEELTEAEEKNVSRGKDGKFNKDYPYINQKPDGKWSFDLWESFLFEEMNEFVIPNVQMACQARGYAEPASTEEPQPEMPADVTSAPAAPHTALTDEDIPF